MASASARLGRGASFSGLLVALWAQSAAASPCSVPTIAHPTLGAAVRDFACTTIQLAAGSYPENVVVARDLAIAGAGAGLSLVAGPVEIVGAGSDVTLAGLSLDGTPAGVAGCWTSLLRATGGARVTADDDVAVANSGLANGPCRIFVDGFESAGMLAWSDRAP